MAAKKGADDGKDRKERILEAAIASFAEVGFDGTSTSAVARKAGVAQPLVHHHFGSKDGLWRAAMDRVFSEVRVFTALDPDLPPKEALVSVMRRFLRLSAQRPEVARIVAREGMTDGPRLQYLVEHFLKDRYGEVVESFRQGQATGILDPSIRPELLLPFVLGAGAHFFDVAPLARRALGVEPEGADGEDFQDMVVDIIIRGVIVAQD